MGIHFRTNACAYPESYTCAHAKSCTYSNAAP